MSIKELLEEASMKLTALQMEPEDVSERDFGSGSAHARIDLLADVVKQLLEAMEAANE